MSVSILTESYETLIAHTPDPIVIEIYATWCPKCSMMKPVFERVAAKLSPSINFYKIDIDISENEAAKLGVDIVPTFLVFHHHKLVCYMVGVLSENVLKQRILESLKE